VWNGVPVGLASDVPVPNPRTVGDFSTEAEAWAEFDRLVLATGAFTLYREVEGDYVQPRPGTELKAARIDRVLVPKLAMVKAGWDGGIIGVEGKRSGEKLGRLINQAIDYTRCVFRLNGDIPNILVMPRWVFIYPCERVHGDLESIMTQNRIGTCGSGRSGLWFQCSAVHALEIQQTGGVTARPINMGNKRGSR
jgi:hypothetical protein